MNPKMREYFRGKLLAWREELLRESSETLQHLQSESLAEPDIADRASLETDRSLELRTRDRERKLIAKIDMALQRIEDGTYGYCEETDEPISLRRLEARPIALDRSAGAPRAHGAHAARRLISHSNAAPFSAPPSNRRAARTFSLKEFARSRHLPDFNLWLRFS